MACWLLRWMKKYGPVQNNVLITNVIALGGFRALIDQTLTNFCRFDWSQGQYPFVSLIGTKQAASQGNPLCCITRFW